MAHIELPKEFLAENESTFQYDEDLPSLPLYPLKQTLHRYIESVQPFLTDEEYRQTEFVVQQFQTGVGKFLHEKLNEKANHSRNWLEKLWEDKAYMEYRMPIAPLVNFGGPGPYHTSIWPAKEGTQVERAALMTWYQLQYWTLLRKEQLAPDKGAGKVPWTMVQYRHLFNTCRIPGVEKDDFIFNFKTEREGSCPSHIIILCRGRIFVFDILDTDQQPLTAPEIQQQLQWIRDYADQRSPGPGLGSLTSENRTTWANIRNHLINLHQENQRNLELIESSLEAVVLDDNSPVGYTEISRQALCGDCCNRWFDKSINTIAFKNGTFGSNCDHAPYEAMVMIGSSYFNLRALELCGGKWLGPTQNRHLEEPRELIFHMDNKIYRALEAAKLNFKKQGDHIEILTPVYEGYGRDFMRSHKLHPDTYVQLALQYNYYKMYGKPAPTYETASIRRYYCARTETHRSCTNEAVAWVKSMLDRNESVHRRFQLFEAAHKKHNDLMSDAQQLKGCDRHLMGLYYMAEELGMEVPAIFHDPAYRKSGGGGNYILSTSYTGNTPVFGGVAAMCPHGYGCFYSIQKKTITFFFSAWTEDEDTSVKGFYSNMLSTMSDMKEMLDIAAPSKL